MAKIVKVFSDNSSESVQRQIDNYTKETKYIPLQISASVSVSVTDGTYYKSIERHTVAIIFETDVSIEM